MNADLQVVNLKNIHTKVMYKKEPFYVVCEIVYPGGIMEVQPHVKETHAYGDDIHRARALAFGFVAKRMNLYRKVQNPLADKIPYLKVFEEDYLEPDTCDVDAIIEKSAKNVPVDSDKKYGIVFNKTDKVFWSITLWKYNGDDLHEVDVYNSGDSPTDVLTNLLGEAMFLDEFSQAFAK